MLELPLLVSILIISSFFIFHWYASLFLQSFFHHRYAAHMQFTISRFWEKTFFLLSYFVQGSSYLSPRTYAIMHRIHHAHTDTDKDPHSPIMMGSLHSMMWKTKTHYANILRDRLPIEEKFKKKLPIWVWLDDIGHSWQSRLFWMSAYTTFYVFFATEWWMYLLLPIHFFMGAVHGAIVNWFAHKIGYVNYKMKNTSTNIINIDLLMWGESLHNNHHRHPSDANFAKKWFEFDPMYPIIVLFHKLGILRLSPKVVR